MGATTVTPNPNTNPFDVPLNSEVQESQQNQAAAVAASPNGNPFNEPLASEKADAAHDAAIQQAHYDGSKMGSKVPNSILNGGDGTGEAIAGLTGLGVAGMAADPVIAAVGAHLQSLDQIVKIAKTLGYTSFGLKEAHDLYKMFSGGSK